MTIRTEKGRSLIALVLVLVIANSIYAHGHGHNHSHSHVGDNSETEHVIQNNIHKRLIYWLVEISNAEEYFKVIDNYVRPLPFYAQALISTTFISVVPIFTIYTINLFLMRNQKMRDALTHQMLAFALGGLLGDVFFHTLPHLNSSLNSKANHHEQTLYVNLLIIVGILSFFLIERLTYKLCEGDSHTHDHSDKSPGSQSDVDKEKEIRYKGFAVISLIGDFIHNFADGLSIGVSYVADFKMGMLTTVTMFFHEIPHEVGDFAIFFQLKYNICQILGLQLVTAAGSLAGGVIGSLIGEIFEKECIAFITGGFIYFSINGLLSELKEVQSMVQLFYCFLSLSFGLYFMYLFALF